MSPIQSVMHEIRVAPCKLVGLRAVARTPISLRMNFRRSLILVMVFGVATSARAERFSVIVPGIPRPVTMSFPDGFTPPGTTAARERRERFLEFYRQNPAMKGKYSEILLRDWESAARLPQIVVGALGATVESQGRISSSDWGKIREMFLKASAVDISKIRAEARPAIEAGSPTTDRTSDELLWLEDQRDPNSVIMLAQMRSLIGDERDDVFSARKLIFYRGYLLFVNVVVDSSKPDALRTVQSYLSAIAIESI